jgi:hypothetical protein
MSEHKAIIKWAHSQGDFLKGTYSDRSLDPLFDDVRDDRRMKALVSRLKLPDFALN